MTQNGPAPHPPLDYAPSRADSVPICLASWAESRYVVPAATTTGSRAAHPRGSVHSYCEAWTGLKAGVPPALTSPGVVWKHLSVAPLTFLILVHQLTVEQRMLIHLPPRMSLCLFRAGPRLVCWWWPSLLAQHLGYRY